MRLITTSQYQSKINQIKYNVWFLYLKFTTRAAAGKPLHCRWWLSQCALELACHLADYPVHCRPAVSQISHLFKSYICSPLSSLLRLFFTSPSLWSSSLHKTNISSFLLDQQCCRPRICCTWHRSPVSLCSKHFVVVLEQRTRNESQRPHEK